MAVKIDDSCTTTLVATHAGLHKAPVNTITSDIEIFDRAARRRARDRATGMPSDHRWLIQRMAEDVLDRLISIQTPRRQALIIGSIGIDWIGPALNDMGIKWFACDCAWTGARGGDGVQCDEDQLPFADESFDLVIACGSLDTVNDLPGALILMRRVLRPDGVLLAAMTGAPSLTGLRRLIPAAEDGGTNVARFHPQIDVRGLGDLLSRAGFTMPVVDRDSVAVNYTSLARCIDDLRGAAMTNVLRFRRPLTKTSWRRAIEAAPGAFQEEFTLLYASAWTASPGESVRHGPVTGMF